MPAFIEGEPTNTLVIRGQSAEFSVTASGDQPLTYQWYFNQIQLIAEGTNATLVLSNVSLAEGGSYLVEVANGYGSVTSTPALLTVRIPPFIISEPTNVSVIFGKAHNSRWPPEVMNLSRINGDTMRPMWLRTRPMRS